MMEEKVTMMLMMRETSKRLQLQTAKTLTRLHYPILIWKKKETSHITINLKKKKKKKKKKTLSSDLKTRPLSGAESWVPESVKLQ